MKKNANQTTETLEVQAIETSEINFNVLGTSPLIMNRFSQKAWQQLLLPSKKQNRAALEQTLKHDPIAEFRGAVYLNRDKKETAAIHIPNGAFHGALAAVAVDLPGAKKAQIERLTRVVDVNINLFGVPRVFCAMVRNSDMNHTPDVRTRPIFPEWACHVSIRFVRPILTQQVVAHLLGAAGKIIGIGDWRGQKGGPYGAFDLVEDNDAEFKKIVKLQGREAQLKALNKPVAFDQDTEELLAWFDAEVGRREMGSKLNKNKVKQMPGIAAIIERGGHNGHDSEYIGRS